MSSPQRLVHIVNTHEKQVYGVTADADAHQVYFPVKVAHASGAVLGGSVMATILPSSHGTTPFFAAHATTDGVPQTALANLQLRLRGDVATTDELAQELGLPWQLVNGVLCCLHRDGKIARADIRRSGKDARPAVTWWAGSVEDFEGEE